MKTFVLNSQALLLWSLLAFCQEGGILCCIMFSAQEVGKGFASQKEVNHNVILTQS